MLGCTVVFFSVYMVWNFYIIDKYLSDCLHFVVVLFGDRVKPLKKHDTYLQNISLKHDENVEQKILKVYGTKLLKFVMYLKSYEKLMMMFK